MSRHYSVAIDGGPEVFTIDTRYRIVRKVGSGSYGTVCSAYDLRADRYCAIKKVYRIFDKRLLTKRCLREIKLLQHFNHHPRIIELFDMDIVDVDNFNEIYLVFNCMDASLHDVIHSDKPINIVQAQWILYQMLSGLKYIHAANVIHRDLKPANILVNVNCDIKICDFGMAREYRAQDGRQSAFLTEYVTTRWYRAPEVMISPNNYSKLIDVWSVGCIFGEILGRRVLFKGRDYIDQLHKILGILGLPESISFWDPSESVATHLEQLCTVNGHPPPRHPIDFRSLFPDCPSDGIDILQQLLQLDPHQRITVTDAIAHPFLTPFGDPEEEAMEPGTCDFHFEQYADDEDLRQHVIDEIMRFRRKQWQQEQCVRSSSMHADMCCGIGNIGSSNNTLRHQQQHQRHATMSLLEQTAIQWQYSKDHTPPSPPPVDHQYDNTSGLASEEGSSMFSGGISW